MTFIFETSYTSQEKIIDDGRDIYSERYGKFMLKNADTFRERKKFSRKGASVINNSEPLCEECQIFGAFKSVENVYG